ncbi:hypothetical protein [Jeotgalibacillus sp. R-1-5s-1]|uniref:hypothetical protein n=1 Tax=Jeotgalibacillus sp. R-1-5s-1 TaxID=2555897 RepID=UPI0010694480|nr:hypothetical protein [Jeotgalibacillus sp. R-1-5s-1]TFD95752.1 hypothetical protein E2491_11255 [Jeotgalibacillus sp. R-1-5s-1]
MENSTKEKYVLYQYLRFFWQKKLYFIFVPVLVAAVAAVTAYALMSAEEKYEAKALVYVGDLREDSLTSPANIQKLINNEEVQVRVPRNGQVELSALGDNKTHVENQVGKALNVYLPALEEEAQEIINVTQAQVNVMDESEKVYENSIKLYQERISSNDLLESEVSDLRLLIADAQSRLSNAQEVSHRMSSDLVLFDEPELLNQTVEETDSFVLEGAAIGFIIGIILTILLLMLMLYINNARRSLNND